ncbi:hypothetical protein Syun_020231 [Stephania yunnanensis]|uniref:Uncharacterized protein n=1 Tax=Stephania yunnanensis TaxID=152371 RepID=A0AAP0IDG7_9MAGN
MTNIPLPVAAHRATATSTTTATTEGALIGLPDRLPRLRRRVHPVHPRIHAGHRRAADGDTARPCGGGAPVIGQAQSGLVLDVVAGDDVDEEVEDVGAGDGGGDVVLLEGAALVLLGVEPGSDGEFEDEELACLGEEDGGFGGDHADVFIGFHDLLDAGEGELVVPEVVYLFDFGALVGPEHLELLLLLLEELLEWGGCCCCCCWGGTGSGLAVGGVVGVGIVGGLGGWDCFFGVSMEWRETERERDGWID